MEIKKRFHPNRFCHVASRQPGACIKTVTHHTKKGLSHKVIFYFGGSPIFLLQSLLEMLFRIYILKKGTRKNLSLC